MSGTTTAQGWAQRRAGDRSMRVLIAAPAGWMDAGDALPVPKRVQNEEVRTEAADVVLLLGEEGAETVLVTGTAKQKLRVGMNAAEIRDQAASSAAMLLHERNRIEKQQHLPDLLIAFFTDLNVADDEASVFTALTRHVRSIVGGFSALVLARGDTADVLHPQGEYAACSAVPWDACFAQPGLVDGAAVTTCAAALRGLVPDLRIATIAHVPVGEGAVLVLVERREERIFEAEDWNILRVLCLQAEMALKRIRLIENVRTLSLTDPLTGLANRRRAGIALTQAWAEAQRGAGLALMLLDLDDFKEINDSRGHAAGDEVLRQVADALRAEARATDVVARYGGDEFLIVLPGGGALGAGALARRLRNRLRGEVSFSVGIAEYSSAFNSVEELTRGADHALYRLKARKPQASDVT